MYKRKVWELKRAIEVEEYHDGQARAPGQKRQARKKLTKEQVALRNQKNKENKARRKLRMHFQVDDYFSRLSYRIDERPTDMEAATKDFYAFRKKLSREYKKRGYELKWMRNIEVGTKNGWHIHFIVNRIPDTDLILRKAWTHGTVHNQLIYDTGGFAKLAAYITKSPLTDSRLRESSYNTSRNLPIPEPEPKIIKWKEFHKIRPPKGYYLDKETYYEGINAMGYKFRTYTFLRFTRD